MPTKTIQSIAKEAAIFGFPLMLMDVSKQVMTRGKRTKGDWAAPINQFFHAPEFPDDTFTNVVTPNVDTLYSSAWLDLSKGPIVLSVPDTQGRYYLMQMMDAWTNVFASPGKRTTGTKAGKFAIIGPNWTGEIPSDIQKIQAPTNTVWIVGRIQTNGKSDYDSVRAIQKDCRLNPLPGSGDGTASENVSNAFSGNLGGKFLSPVEQVFQMDSQTFFQRFVNSLIENPAKPADGPVVKDMRAIGLVTGQLLPNSKGFQERLAAGFKEGLNAIQERTKGPLGRVINGWFAVGTGDEQVGTYGTQYLWRATVAVLGLGANLSADAIYPRTTVDANGQPLDGRFSYVMHFGAGDLPPANAFWSLTLYNSKQALVKNPIQRFGIGDRDPLKFNPDGSLDLFIQREDPGSDRQANWLPAPEGEFNLFLRLYWPKAEALDDRWIIPGIQKLANKARSVA
jgi:hypothetical protein